MYYLSFITFHNKGNLSSLVCQYTADVINMQEKKYILYKMQNMNV